jgi:hypothetical protein
MIVNEFGGREPEFYTFVWVHTISRKAIAVNPVTCTRALGDKRPMVDLRFATPTREPRSLGY